MSIRLAVLAGILLVSAGGLDASGLITTYSSRAAFGGDATADWGALGPTIGPGLDIGTLFNDMQSSVPGVAVSGASPSLLDRVDQDINYAGNFAPRDRLLMTTAVAARGQIGRAPGPIHLTFTARLVFGAGLQISTNVPGPFTATLKVFDAAGVLIGNVSASAASTIPATGDNSAPFLGIRSSLQEIAAIEVDVPGVTGVTVNAVAIALGAEITVAPPPVVPSGKITSYSRETLSALFGSDAVVDWGGLGATFGSQVVIGNFNNLASSVATVSVSGSSPVSDLTRVDQGINYFGNFAPGERLLTTSAVQARGIIAKVTGPIRLAFNAPLFGVGLQISTDLPGPFTATMKTFNSDGVLLGTAQTSGSSSINLAGDNSAPFLGMRSSVAEIAAVEVDIPGATGVTIGPLLIALHVPL